MDLGVLKNYLGIQVEKVDNIYYINQEKYIDKVLNDMGLQDAKISRIPLDPGYFKIRTSNDALPNNNNYQQLIGILLHIAVNTRPDIAATTTFLSQFNQQSTESDWNEAKRVLRYLKGTKHKRLKLGGAGKHTKLIGYADANWAEDRSDRKSNKGYIFKLAGGCISWACRKQTCVSLSSTEAEYVALAEACQEGIWIIRLLEDIKFGHNSPLTMYEDNQSCIKMIENRRFSHRTKHIDTKYQYVNQLYEE